MEKNNEKQGENFNFSKDKLTLVMIHGAGDSSIFWKPLIKEFTDSFNILPIDLPGHGLNSSSHCLSIDEYAQFIDDLII